MERADRLSHAYIISAPPEQGYQKALELASAMLCQGPDKRPCGVCRSCVKVKKEIHPDVITVARAKDESGKARREILVDQIRAVSASSATLPNEGSKKIYIVRDAGTMNGNAQNAFLKLLEEPPAFDCFILIADNAGQLLETVRSRCVILYLSAPDAAFSENASALAENYLALAAAGDPVALLAFLNANAELHGADAAEFIDCASRRATDMLCGTLPDGGLSRAKLMALIRLLAKARSYLLSNVSVKQLFGLLSVRTIDLK